MAKKRKKTAKNKFETILCDDEDEIAYSIRRFIIDNYEKEGSFVVTVEVFATGNSNPKKYPKYARRLFSIRRKPSETQNR